MLNISKLPFVPSQSCTSKGSVFQADWDRSQARVRYNTTSPICKRQVCYPPLLRTDTLVHDCCGLIRVKVRDLCRDTPHNASLAGLFSQLVLISHKGSCR